MNTFLLSKKIGKFFAYFFHEITQDCIMSYYIRLFTNRTPRRIINAKLLMTIKHLRLISYSVIWIHSLNIIIFGRKQFIKMVIAVDKPAFSDFHRILSGFKIIGDSVSSNGVNLLTCIITSVIKSIIHLFTGGVKLNIPFKTPRVDIWIKDSSNSPRARREDFHLRRDQAFDFPRKFRIFVVCGVFRSRLRLFRPWMTN